MKNNTECARRHDQDSIDLLRRHFNISEADRAWRIAVCRLMIDAKQHIANERAARAIDGSPQRKGAPEC